MFKELYETEEEKRKRNKEKKERRKLLVGGNWKCNNTLEESSALVRNIVNKIEFDPAKIGKFISYFQNPSP